MDRGYRRETAMMRPSAKCARVAIPAPGRGVGELSLYAFQAHVDLRQGHRPIYHARFVESHAAVRRERTAWRVVGEAGFQGIPGALPAEGGRLRRPPAGPALRV